MEMFFSFFKIFWVILFLALGIGHIVIWSMAASHCQEKSTMLNPLWFFMRSNFDEKGEYLCKLDLKVVAGLVALFAFGRFFELY